MRRGCVVVVLSAVVAVAAGCGGGSTTAGPSPVPLSVHTPAEDSSASASPTLDPNSDAAILAAVQAYAAAFSDVGREASTAPLTGVVDPTCPCEDTLSSLADQLHSKAEHVDAIIVASNVRILRRSAVNADVAVQLSNSAYHVLDSHNHIVQTAKAASTTSTLSFERKGTEWLIFYVRSGVQ